jgi:hypothetical protein
LEGVGILSLNETCKAYATRDLLIPHKTENKEEYLDFIPHSKIKETEEIQIDLPSTILKTKHVHTNQMYDLGLVAKSTTEIKEIIKKRVEIEAAKEKRHGYLLYLVNAITIVSLLLFIITCIEQLPWFKTKTHTELEPEPPMSLESTEEPELTNMIEDIGDP